MTTDRDFDRIATAWLAEGPDELSNRVLDSVIDQIHVTRQRRAMRVPRRFPTMTIPARVAAAAVVGALAVGGAYLALGGSSQSYIGTPSPSPSTSTPAVSPLTSTFTSPRYGYAIQYPSGWTASPATKPWLAGTDPLYSDPTIDTIGTSDARLAIASQPLAGTSFTDRRILEGQSPDEWLVAHCGSSGSTGASCGSPILIGGQSGWLAEDGTPAAGGTVATGGVIYAASVVYKDRGYVFTLDGKVDRALFDELLANVRFNVDSAIDLPPLTKTFTSPTYGYTIGVGEGFRTTPATSKWSPGANTGETPKDVMGTTKDDWLMNVASIAIPAGTSFDQWLAAKFPPIAADNGEGLCPRADPATWPQIQVGNQVGRLLVHCHGVEAVIGVEDRAYDFDWEYQVTHTNHTLADWKELLKSVVFDPGSATP